jgi:Ras-related GTP-binding protein A/B
MRYFEDIIASLRDNSSDAGVWVLVNKMDLADKEDPSRKAFGEKRAEIMGVHEKVWKGKEKKGLIRLFGTTIWDESLYKVGDRL